MKKKKAQTEVAEPEEEHGEAEEIPEGSPAETEAEGSRDGARSHIEEPEEPELSDEEKIVRLTEQLEAAEERILRLRAEQDNFRKRKLRELDDTRKNTKIATLEEILPVLDQFQMAVAAIQTADDLETIKQGMEMILNTFHRCFDNLGVERVQTVGQPFDPNVHEAVSAEASDEAPAEHIISEWKAGYRLGNWLLRPAAVVVSTGPVEPAVADEATEENEETGEEE